MKYTANDMGMKGATGNASKLHRERVEKKSGMHRRRKFNKGRTGGKRK